MRCVNCGFESDGEELCPVCGGELRADVDELVTKALVPEPTEPQNTAQAAQPSNEGKTDGSGTKKLKRLVIICTAVICAVTILCCAAVCVFGSFLREDMVLKIYNGYYADKYSDYYYNTYDDGNHDDGDYESYSVYNPLSYGDEYEFDYGTLSMTGYKTTADTLSADRELCEDSFTFEIKNISSENLYIGGLRAELVSAEEQPSAQEFETHYVGFSDAAQNGYSDKTLEPGETAAFDCVFTGPKDRLLVLTVTLEGMTDSGKNFSVSVPYKIQLAVDE